ncbi:MAG: hypothetical protein GC134_06675 [Proteobacteria bacterium]|nr:hypothetical protein [Pseudomonadota bacterium]
MKFLFALNLLLAALMYGLPAHAITDEGAPLQIVNSEIKDGVLEVTVDAGTKGDVPERVTLLTQRGQGYVHAELIDKQRSCELLCGDDQPQTCHVVAIYKAKIAGYVGQVYAALPYLAQISKQEVIDPLQHPSRLPKNLRGHVGKTVFTPMYPNDLALRLQGWDFDTDSVLFDYKYKGSEGPFEAARVPGCGIFGQDRFLNVDCGDNLSLMFEDDHLLLVSFADYGRAVAKILLGFEMNGKRQYLVRIGLKSEEVIGLLEPDESGGWILRLRPADYPKMC